MAQEPDLVIWGFQTKEHQHLSGFDVQQLSAGCYHSAILTRDGAVYTWGDRAEYGMLGHGCEDSEPLDIKAPKRVAALVGKKICHISSAGTYMAAVQENGTLYTWGTAVYGQHGNGARCLPSPTPVLTLRNIPVRRVSCGRYHVAVVTDRGVYTWGNNSYGQLGHSAIGETITTPTLVDFDWDEGPFDVAVGWNHTAVISCSGRLYTFGCGKYGVLGHGNERNRADPAVVKSVMNHRICQVSCGGSVTTALTDSGEVYVCGEGAYGQLGLGPQQTACLLSFVRINALSSVRIVTIASGWGHTAAIDDYGRVWVWGYNCHQQVAHDDRRTHYTPIMIKPAHAGQPSRSLIAHTASCGYYHTMVFSTPVHLPPSDLPSWRLSTAAASSESLQHRLRAGYLSQVAGALAVSTQKLGETCEQLTASNRLLCVRNAQLTTENQTLRRRLEMLTNEVSTVQLRNSMTQLQMERLLVDLPPMSPFGSDAAFRTHHDLTRSAPMPAERRSLAASVKLRAVYAVRLLSIATRQLFRGIKGLGLLIIPRLHDRSNDLFRINANRLPVYQRICQQRVQQEEAEAKRLRRKARKMNKILLLGYQRHHTLGLRDVLISRRLRAAAAASNAWSLHRMQALPTLRLLERMQDVVRDRS